MNTKINNGFYIHPQSLDDLFQKSVKAKKLIHDYHEKLHEQNALVWMAREFEKDTKNIHSKLVDHIAKCQQAGREGRNVDFDYETSWVFLPRKGEIFALFYGFNDAQEIWQDIFSALDFSYWNNTDRPSHILESEWNGRGRIWNEILGYDPPCEKGFTFQCYGRYSQPLYLDCAGNNDVWNRDYVVDARCKQIAQKKLDADWVKIAPTIHLDNIMSEAVKWLTSDEVIEKTKLLEKEALSELRPLSWDIVLDYKQDQT